jgi:hypothetical protein
MVSVAIFCPGSQGWGIFLCSVVQRLTWYLGNFLKFLGGGVLALRILKIGIAGEEQCLCGHDAAASIWGGGGWVGSTPRQNASANTAPEGGYR